MSAQARALSGAGSEESHMAPTSLGRARQGSRGPFRPRGGSPGRLNNESSEVQEAAHPGRFLDLSEL